MSDSRDKIVDCSTCPTVQIYENETVIFFQVSGQELQVKQKGTITIKYKDGNVLFFENNILLFSACKVEDVRKQNNDIYADTYLELVVALSAFLGFSDSGGGGIANVANGIYDDGGTAKLGGDLVEDTVITEDGFVLTQIRTENVNGANVTVAALTDLGDPFGTGGTGLSRGLALNSDTGTVSAFVWSDNISDAAAALIGSSGDFQASFEARPTTVVMKTVNAGITESQFLLSGVNALFECATWQTNATNAIRFNTPKIEQPLTGKYVWGETDTDNSIRIGVESGALVAQKRIAGSWTTMASISGVTNEETYVQKNEYINTHIKKRETAFTIDLNSTNPVQVYAFPMTDQKQYRFKFIGLFRRTGLSGVGFFEVTAGANRSTALGSGLSSPTPNIIAQENIAGTGPVFTHAIQTISGVPNYVFFIDSNVAINTRYETYVEIIESSIEDIF